MIAQSKSRQFAQRLNQLLNDMDVPPMNLGRARWFHNYIKNTLKIDVSYEAARKWLSGESIPYTKRIGIIAKGLNSSIEYLIGENNNNVPHDHTGIKESSAQYNMDDIAILEKIRLLSNADKGRISSIIDVLNSKNDNKN